MKQVSKSHLSRITPCLIFWFLWSERNNSRHNVARFRAFSVIWQVQTHIHRLVESGRLRPKHWQGVSSNIPLPVQAWVRLIIQRVTPIKWHPPDSPWLKLNISGIFTAASGQASGGGIIRDQDGKLISAFTTPFKASYNLEATLMTIEQGLLQVKDNGQPVWLETDAHQAVAMINTEALGPAHIRHSMMKIRLIQKDCSCKFSYIHKEGNRAAILLAEMGTRLTSLQILDDLSTPRLLRAIIRLEQNGTPYVRIEEEEED